MAVPAEPSPTTAAPRSAPSTDRAVVDEVDVVVVGAGPAGSAAAITLASAGRTVVLADKAAFPRDKCCGDGLTTEALRELEAFGLDPAAVPSWTAVDDIHVTSPSGRTITFPLPRGHGLFAVSATRLELDAALVDRARTAGAKVLDGHGCVAVDLGADHVIVTLEGIGRIAARYLVAADGMWSPVRKLVGAPHEPGYLGEWHAFRQYFSGVDGSAATDMHVWFEPDLVPGYVWSFPLGGGRANVGFGIHRGGRLATRKMAVLWPELLARPHIRAALGAGAHPEAPHRAWPIPARIDRAPLSGAGGRVLFVGDAAAAVDPMTGEGIAQALVTGRLAADAIVDAGPFHAAVAADTYRAAVRRRLLADHRMSVLLIRALRHRRGARAAVRVAGLTAWTRRNFARWLFEDYPRAMVVTPRRWRRGMFTGPGAYRTGRPAGGTS